jgi:hypothetical protein
MLMLALRRFEFKKHVSTHSTYFSKYRNECLLDTFHLCVVIYVASATTLRVCACVVPYMLHE